MRTHIRAKDRLPAGKARIEAETAYVERKPGGPPETNFDQDSRPGKD